MKKITLLFGVGMFLVATSLLFAQQKYQTLKKIQIAGDTVTMQLSGAAKYHAFKISNPARIVVEFSDTEFKAKERELKGAGGLVVRVRGGQFKDEPLKVARVVVDLSSSVDYQLIRNDNDVLLALTKPPHKTSSAWSRLHPTQAALAREKEAAAQKVLPNPTVQKDSTEGEKQPEVTIVTGAPSPLPPAEVIAMPIVSDAVQPQDAQTKQSLDTNKEKKNNAPVAHASAPLKEDAVPAAAHSILPTKPITIDFDEADIRDVLRVLALKSGINIIYGGDVTGTLSIRLENVPFDKAFETIMSLKNLVAQEQSSSIIRVVSPQRIADERAQAVTFTKIYPLNYAKADEVKTNLDSIRSAEGRRGNTSVDIRTNSLIITDTPEGLSSSEQIISELDKKPQQVIIEAKIVELVLSDALDLGIEWEYARTIPTSRGTMTIGQTTLQTADTLGTGNNGAVILTPNSPLAGGTGVSLPATAVGGQIGAFSFGLVEDSSRLTAMITALAQKGQSKLLSNPKVTTINNRQARILVGQKIPYTTTTVSVGGTTSQTNFLDVGIKLSVTPTINKDKKITLDVHPEVSLFIRNDPAGPVIGTREAMTTVIVANGETVVIGGLITEDDRKLGVQVPLLGDLPIIGYLFRHQNNTKDRTELLVFLTPQITE